MRRYPLATLVAIRERREQDAALELSRREQVLAKAEEALRRCQQALDSFRQWRPAEEDRRWKHFLAKASQRKDLDVFRESLADLEREELLLEQKVDDAGKSVEAARSDRDEAARRHIELARQLEKLNEHRKEWTRESEREEQRSDEKVLEDFHRRREEARFTEELDFNVS
jgi:AAA ATPase containing von Willebrand factor type A (vWA) domain